MAGNASVAPLDDQSTRQLIEALGALQRQIRQRRQQVPASQGARPEGDDELHAMYERSAAITRTIVLRLTGRGDA
jgi:hypothetical protein